MFNRTPAQPVHRKRRPPKALLLALLPLLAGCPSTSSTSPASSAASQPSASQTPTAPYLITNNVPAPGSHLYIPDGRYVAMGDSFSSGEGNPPFLPGTNSPPLPGTPDICHRSYVAYSQVLQAKDPQNAAPIPDDADFVACQGAKIQALFHYNVDNPSEPPQVDRLNVGAVESTGQPGGPVGLITLSIGGNDVGFGPIIQHCLWANLFASSCNASEQHALDVNLHWIDGTYPGNAPAGPSCGYTCDATKKCPPGSGCNPENLVQVYQTLRYLAPHARILVLGYPQEFRLNNSPSCKGISRADQKWANTNLTDALNKVIQANIQAANAGIEYVNAVPYFLHHEQECNVGDPQSGFNGLLNLGLGLDYEGYFHPSKFGHTLLAQAILDKLSHPAPTGYPSPPSPSPSVTPVSPTPPASGGSLSGACSMLTFQNVLTALGGKDVQPFGNLVCAGSYGMGPFIIGAGNLPGQYIFKRGGSGNWVFVADAAFNLLKACAVVPPNILRQLIGVEVISCP